MSETWPTGFMLQGPPMLNMHQLETSLSSLELLDTLQAIEQRLGRRRLVEKGPRTLDLDILLYDDQIIQEDRLVVPHKLMLERFFVLQPLCQ